MNEEASRRLVATQELHRPKSGHEGLRAGAALTYNHGPLTNVTEKALNQLPILAGNRNADDVPTPTSRRTGITYAEATRIAAKLEIPAGLSLLEARNWCLQQKSKAILDNLPAEYVELPDQDKDLRGWRREIPRDEPELLSVPLLGMRLTRLGASMTYVKDPGDVVVIHPDLVLEKADLEDLVATRLDFVLEEAHLDIFVPEMSQDEVFALMNESYGATSPRTTATAQAQ